MPPRKQLAPVQQTATGDRNVQIAGDSNTVSQTTIQKIFNVFRSDTETTAQRNRRIMISHVENFWVKGILEKSLHGAALLELGIKEDPDALKYPWTIKREATKETLPPGTSMLEIFQEIGLGRSLLILGAPGSGKTTMLLELTRLLVDCARQDLTEPIPLVFNLSSWRDNLSLSDWLVRELNVIYAIPNKVAPNWIKENKMLLLLDGLDEVKQESRNQCINAINQFRKENGLTSMAVCSRTQDYAELKARLSFDGAIEIQPLTSEQVKGYFKRFGKELAGIRKVLEKESVLREMAETPLFLSIMTLSYRGADFANVPVSKDVDQQRNHLFDTYIEGMFKRRERSKNERFKEQDVLYYLHWLAQQMIEHNQVPFHIERIQPSWLDQRNRAIQYRLLVGLVGGLTLGLIYGLVIGVIGGLAGGLLLGLVGGLIFGLIFGLVSGLLVGLDVGPSDEINTVDTLIWRPREVIGRLIYGLVIGVIGGLAGGLAVGLIVGLIVGLVLGLQRKQVELITRPGERLFLSTKNALFISLLVGILFGLLSWLAARPSSPPTDAPIVGLLVGLLAGPFIGLNFGGRAIIQHYALRIMLSKNKLLPWNLIPFLDYCVDLIFLRRVGGGYIFVHRLLMEHFAAMYSDRE